MFRKKVSVLVGIVLSASLLTGCVTQDTYTGTNTPVAERKVDKEAAARHRVQLGLTYLQRGNSEQAKANLDKALAFAPDIEEVHIAYAYYYSYVGELEKTEQAYLKATRVNGASGNTFNNFGTFLCQHERYDESELMFLKAIEQPSYVQSASTYENLGICSRKSGQIDKARDYFNHALKYDPRRRTSLLELTELELEAGRYIEAKAQLSRYHNLAVQTAASLAIGIEIEQGLKNDEAVKDFGILLLAKFPSSPQAKQYRANMH
ncbi:type IV pilus biogenesis/stability protein PilW [Shewanella youngdeokensis]|uniref:Type IV pilus biogenesis/stability protein PilW n=1 Tax=Shewanella youngdeokensis TaxID=2999068 RepID=A0ABZ0K250_9GAMM|nr:type IV pilus biogenesis/stability protein PilW [Shewanella sp. DAU334]